MRTVYHPTIAGISYEVDDAHVTAWKDAGWRLTPPAETAATAPAAEDNTTDKEND